MQVTQEYVDGIKEGREHLKQFNCTLQDMKDNLANCQSTMKGFSAGPVKEMLKGERDFWKAQIKKI